MTAGGMRPGPPGSGLPHLLLFDFDRADAAYHLDPATGVARHTPRAGRPCRGWAVRRGTHLMALWADGAGPWLLAGGAIHALQGVAIAWNEADRARPERHVVVRRGTHILATLEYRDQRAADYWATADADWTAAEPEDFDWARFLTVIVADPGRVDRVARSAR